MYTFSGSIEYDGSHLLQSWRLIAATNDRLRARTQSRKAELEAALDVDRRRRRRRSATELESFRGTSACTNAVLAFFLSLFGYVQSACFSGSGSACAVSSPRGRRSLRCTCCLLLLMSSRGRGCGCLFRETGGDASENNDDRPTCCA